MENERRDKFYGITIEAWVAQTPAELAIDAVGLWQIVSSGREGFGLSGDELLSFVTRSILALFAAGAKPVIGAQDGIHIWAPVSYGDTINEMCDAIILEWQNSGRDPDVGGVWFALPHIYEAKISWL